MEAEILIDLEEGEIEDTIGEEDAPEEIYIPLERPLQPAPRVEKPTTNSDSASEASSESDSDSDSNSQRRRRRKSKKIYRETVDLSGPPKKKINTIWCVDAAEDNLTSTMLNCNVNRNMDHSRDVETYDPSLFNNASAEGPASNKRNHLGSHVGAPVKAALKKQKSLQRTISLAGRDLSPLTKTVDDPPNLLAEDIATKLSEEKQIIIENVIEVAGKQMAIDFFEETVQIEQNGGLLVMNGARRRTPGGVYFHVVKYSQDLTPDQVREIFKDDRRQTARDIKKSKAALRKEAISKEDYPTLLSRAEAAIYKKKHAEVETEDAEVVKNPPPSPATDGRDNSNSSCDVDHPKDDTMEVSSSIR